MGCAPPVVMLPVVHAQLGHWHLVVSLYGVAIALGVGLGLVVAVGRARDCAAVLVVAPIAVVAGVVASELWHRVCHGSPGLSSMGGIAGGLIAIALVSRLLRVPALEMQDALAPGALVGFAVGRVGCFFAGCCYGGPTDLPWGVVFPALGLPARHPVQLYEAAVDVGLAWWCGRASGPAGVTVGRAMIGYGLGRVLLEVLRDPGAVDLVTARGPSVVQTSALVLVAVGLRLVLRPLSLHRVRDTGGVGR